MINALTVDLEDWYHICGVEELADISMWDHYESRIIRNTNAVLSLLSAWKTKATFFVLGYIALREPDLIRTISSQGHEIATHGFYHRRIFELTPSEFEEDIARSVDVISSASGQPVKGFRSPEWSIRPDSLWVLDILGKLGILYDSSMVPMTGMGSRDFPVYPVEIKTENGPVWEFPLTTRRILWENVPFTGGLPLRIAPYRFTLSSVKRINAGGHPCMVYVHPWEFDLVRTEIQLPLSRRFMHDFNRRVTRPRIEGLLERFRFGTMEEVLGV